MDWPSPALLLAALTGCGGGGGGGGSAESPPSPPPESCRRARPSSGPAWPMFSRDAQHTTVERHRHAAAESHHLADARRPGAAISGGGYLLTHYGSPVISSMNTVLVPVKTAAQGSFRFEARSGANGGLIWSATSDYVVPPHNWFPSFNRDAHRRTAASTRPGAGGKLLLPRQRRFGDRDAADGRCSTAPMCTPTPAPSWTPPSWSARR